MFKEIVFDRDTSFISPTYGKITLERVSDLIISYIKNEPESEYEIAIGTDSMTHDVTKFALAITVHKLHHGGIYFYKTMIHDYYRQTQLYDKLFKETEISLMSSKVLIDLMKEKGLDIDNTNIKIRYTVHVDVGNYGKTKDYIQSLVGMVHSYGYDCEIKPNSYAASSIADRLSK